MSRIDQATHQNSVAPDEIKSVVVSTKPQDNFAELDFDSCYRRDSGGYPLIGNTENRSLQYISIRDLELLGLTFHRAWPHQAYENFEAFLNYGLFKRLNGVSQMQICFSNAGVAQTNSRFFHSLYAAQKAYECLIEINKASKQDDRFLTIGPDTIRATVMATLLHDYAHGPFSHVFEYVAHVFDNQELFSHDLAIRTKIANDPNLVSLLMQLHLEPQVIIEILSDHDNYLHQIAKVFSDRLAYLQTDSIGDLAVYAKSSELFENQSTHERLGTIIDITERVKHAMRIIEHKGQPTLVFLADELSAIDELFTLRKLDFANFCMNPNATLAAAIVGRNLKLLVQETEDRERLVQTLANLTDRQFIEQLSNGDHSNPKLMQLFYGAKKLDEHYYPVLSFNFDHPLFSLMLLSKEFRQGLRRYVYQALDIEHDDIYAAHPLGDEAFQVTVTGLDVKSFELIEHSFSYNISDSAKSFTIFLDRKHIDNDCSGEKSAKIKNCIQEFIANYRLDANNLKI